ncbi:MAG: STAS-like domain-containing protein [Deltaproteobacteria bacterium]
MQKESITISVFEVVGSPLCVASGDGQKVYDRIEIAIKENRHITLSFFNVSTLTSAFLNTAVGQLYGTFSKEEIRSLLKVEDMQSDDMALLKRVVEMAKQYFKDPHRSEKPIQEMLEGGDGE